MSVLGFYRILLEGVGEKPPTPTPFPVALVSLVLVKSAAKHVTLYDISGQFQSLALPVSSQIRTPATVLTHL